jgi:hypothetical protein
MDSVGRKEVIIQLNILDSLSGRYGDFSLSDESPSFSFGKIYRYILAK